jgi:hypothetical protein
MIKTGDIFMKDNIVERYNEIYEKLEANVRAFYPEGSQEHKYDYLSLCCANCIYWPHKDKY